MKPTLTVRNKASPQPEEGSHDKYFLDTYSKVFAGVQKNSAMNTCKIDHYPNQPQEIQFMQYPKTVGKSSKRGRRSAAKRESWATVAMRSAEMLLNAIRSTRYICASPGLLLTPIKNGLRDIGSSLRTYSRVHYYYRTRPETIRLKFEYNFLCSISPEVLEAFIPYLIEQSKKPRSGFGRQVSLRPASISIQRRTADDYYEWHALSTLSVEDVKDLDSHRMCYSEVERFGRFARRRHRFEEAELLARSMEFDLHGLSAEPVSIDESVPDTDCDGFSTACSLSTRSSRRQALSR